MIVLDASAVLPALLDDGPRGKHARAAIDEDLEWFAPVMLGFEVLHQLRQIALNARDEARRAEATEAADEFLDWPVRTFDSPTMLTRVWQLRDNVDASDAFYVAAAEQLGCPLLTADQRLSAAPGPRCAFRLVTGDVAN